MMKMKKIEKTIRKFEVGINAQKDKIILDKVLKAQKDSKEQSSAPGGLNIWRLIMNSKITKLATAAVIIIAASVIIHFSGGTVTLTTIAFAEITEALKTMPWMHMESHSVQTELPTPVNLWIGYESKIAASKLSNGNISFTTLNEHKSYSYDPENNTITIDYVIEESFPANMSSTLMFFESIYEQMIEHGAQITTKEAEYNGQKVQLQEVALPWDEQGPSLSLYIQHKTKLLLAIKGNVISDGEIFFTYPKTGPTDIYALGVPRDAEIINKFPDDEFMKIWDIYRQKRQQATEEYIAFITRTNSSFGDIITNFYADYKSHDNHRLEYHWVLTLDELRRYEELWPEYEAQLGNSLESIMAWSQANISSGAKPVTVYLHDGQYQYSIDRDENSNWSTLSQIKTSSIIASTEHLAYTGWPVIGSSGHIIDDDYAKENNLICIERLQQGATYEDIISLPARFLYYIDPQKDYICVRKVTEWYPSREENDWLVGKVPESIGNGSITVEDITEIIQVPNGHWYPKTIEIKQTGIRQDYQEAPLKLTSTKRIYLNTNPVFPEGIFDPENLPK